MGKMYDPNDKYGGLITQSLDRSFAIFMDLCDRAEIPPKIYPRAFPTMLQGTALDFYYTNCSGYDLELKQLFRMFKDHFEGKEHVHNLLREWNATTLRGELKKAPDKPRAGLPISKRK